jgi:hypothetical protein
MKFPVKKGVQLENNSPRNTLARGLHCLLKHGLEPPLPIKWRKRTVTFFQSYWEGEIEIEELFRRFYALTDPKCELDADYYYLWFLDHFRDFLGNVAERGKAQLRDIALREVKNNANLE